MILTRIAGAVSLDSTVAPCRSVLAADPRLPRFVHAGHVGNRRQPYISADRLCFRHTGPCTIGVNLFEDALCLSLDVAPRHPYRDARQEYEAIAEARIRAAAGCDLRMHKCTHHEKCDSCCLAMPVWHQISGRGVGRQTASANDKGIIALRLVRLCNRAQSGSR